MPARPGHRGLRTRLQLWLMASATLVLAITGVIDWSLESSRVRADRDRATQATLERLALVLPAAIEDLDTGAVRNAVTSELTNPHVAALTVVIAGKSLADERRAGAQADGIPMRRALRVANEAGEILLHSDPEPLAQAQRAVVLQTIVSMVAINLLIALAVSIVVARLTRPISTLTTAAEAIAAGNLDAPLPTGGAMDEVAVLTRSFAAMRDAVRRQLADIAEQNRVLDERVRERTSELERLHQELLIAAHQAGRAEIATSVLHNIGNVLTGAFVDLDGLRREAASELPRRAQQLRELLGGERDLARFIRDDHRGRELPRFLQLFLDELIAAEARDDARTERLSTALGLVRDTLAVQQNYATTRAFVQPLDLGHEVEQMLLLHTGALDKRGVRVLRQVESTRTIEADRSKVGHVIANLLKNAIEALDDVAADRRELHLSLRQAFDGTVELAVRDSGNGISAEAQGRLFSYGFTTKDDGHGFGLHWCANAMKEMGGAIRAESPGPGQGATFTLIFPVKPPAAGMR